MLAEEKEQKDQWTIEKLQTLYDLPFIELISRAHHVHTAHHKVGEVQMSALLSIKTGGCSEDCKYCAQSSRYQTEVSPQRLMKCDEVLAEAKKAQARGATRFCLGAAWREVRDSPQFEEILRMVKGVCKLGMEACCTLGMIKEHQARALKEAGLYAYNHNLDTSESFYSTIISTRTYQERIHTLETVEQAGLTICCGGIIGMGETVKDRLELILTLSTRTPQPDSVPINRLTPIPGTPLQDQPPVPFWDLCRLVALARITMPKTMVRLSSGRETMSIEEQALCFFAGANSIFLGEKLLTVGNPTIDKDREMFQLLGITPQPAYAKGSPRE